MKRFLALLALVLVLMAGTAGMASARTIGFDLFPDGLTYPPDEQNYPSLPYPPEISGTASLTWSILGGDTGWSPGHLWCTKAISDSIIFFTGPTYVNSFQMVGEAMAPDPASSYYTYGPKNIAAFNAANVQVWSTTVKFDEDHRDVGNNEAWQTVVVETANVKKIIFYATDPGAVNGYPWFDPSIDNLVINEGAAVPIPAAVWLLAAGLLRLAGLRKKFIF